MSAKRTVDVLSKVRALMKNAGPLQAYIVPWTDPHDSEYLAECDRQRAFLSGFTGSAGTAVVTEAQACLWTDGRYYLQASKEMDSRWTLMKESLPETPSQATWLSSILPSGSTVGVNFSLIKHNDWKTLNDQLQAAGHTLVSVPSERDLVEQVWEDRPIRPRNQVSVLPVKFAGRSVSDKIKDIRQAMTKNNAAAFVVSALDEVAWTLNLRGTDIPYNPVFFAYLVITHKCINLFIDNTKLTSEAHDHLASVDAKIHSYEDIFKFINNFAQGHSNQRIWFGSSANRALTGSVPEKALLVQASPIALMKAIKNETEIQGMKQAHIRDGAAVCRYFAWLEKVIAAGEKVTEASGATRLEKFRSEMEHFAGLSFDTISSVGPNGAIIHYHPSEEGSETDLQITNKALYLCDSGGQYLDGTTDITRTIHLGTPTDRERECFTRVLKGQIQLGTAVFPDKIRGNCLDTLARKYLWDVGLNYAHGTGHGIGSYLCVHEGPMGISWRVYPDDPGLQAGMFLSNEPGYYEDGNFGIRLENIVYIVPFKSGTNFLTFETVTLVPIQKKMIMREMLTEKEINEINNYHIECRMKITPLLKDKDDIEWLRLQTEPL